MIPKPSSGAISLAFGVFVFLFLIGFYVLAWTEPASLPPTGNVSTPVNIGPTNQIKSGGLWVGSLGVSNGAVLAVSGGNVGIGTTGPNEKLAVIGNVAIGSTNAYGYNLYIGATSPQIFLDSSVNSHIQLQGRESGSAKTIKLSSAGSGNLAIVPGDNPGSGNVGIGTVAPGGRLHVRSDTTSSLGKVILQSSTNDSGTSGTKIVWQNANSSEVAEITAVNAAGDGPITFSNIVPWTGPMTERMRIDRDGNVGIGTTSPGAKLDVQGGSVRVGNFNVTPISATELGVYDSGGNQVIIFDEGL